MKVSDSSRMEPTQQWRCDLQKRNHAVERAEKAEVETGFTGWTGWDVNPRAITKRSGLVTDVNLFSVGSISFSLSKFSSLICMVPVGGGPGRERPWAGRARAEGGGAVWVRETKTVVYS